MAAACVVGALPANAVHAAPVRPGLLVAPATPTRATPLTVSWRAPATGRYLVTLTIRPAETIRLACSYGASAKPLRAGPGPRRVAVLRPSGDVEETRRWCTGPGTVTVRRLPSGSGAPVIVATRRITIRRARNELPPGPADTPASVRLLAGSTITLSSPAAPTPDRTSAVGGVLRGLIPSPFRLASDISITRMGGALTPVGMAAAPLCGKAVSVQSMQVAPATTMVVRASGDVVLTLVLVGASGQLSGCGPGDAPSGTTTVTLTGRPGAKGLLALPLAGAAEGITLNLVVQVDLSGRP